MAGSLSQWAAENCSVEDPVEIQAIKDKAADALVKALGMQARTTCGAWAAQAEPEVLDVDSVKAKACDALQKALRALRTAARGLEVDIREPKSI